MLTYANLDLQDENYAFDIYSGFFEPADVRRSDGVILGKRGLDIGNSLTDRRLIDIRGTVRAETPAELAVALQELMAVLDMEADPQELEVTPNTLGVTDTWTIDARTTSVTMGPLQGGMTFALISFVLEAVSDPPEWVAES